MEFKCNGCPTIVKSDTLPSGWVAFTEVNIKGVRLYEECVEYRYESFHIPNKTKKYYHDKLCALNSMKKSFELFLAEISPIKPPRSRTVL